MRFNLLHRIIQNKYLWPIFKWVYYKPHFYLCCVLWPKLMNKPRWYMTMNISIDPDCICTVEVSDAVD